MGREKKGKSFSKPRVADWPFPISALVSDEPGMTLHQSLAIVQENHQTEQLQLPHRNSEAPDRGPLEPLLLQENSTGPTETHASSEGHPGLRTIIR